MVGLEYACWKKGSLFTFVSRTLTETESRYAQLGRETFTICFATKKVHLRERSVCADRPQTPGGYFQEAAVNSIAKGATYAIEVKLLWNGCRVYSWKIDVYGRRYKPGISSGRKTRWRHGWRPRGHGAHSGQEHPSKNRQEVTDMNSHSRRCWDATAVANSNNRMAQT